MPCIIYSCMMCAVLCVVDFTLVTLTSDRLGYCVQDKWLCKKRSERWERTLEASDLTSQSRIVCLHHAVKEQQLTMDFSSLFYLLRWGENQVIRSVRWMWHHTPIELGLNQLVLVCPSVLTFGRMIVLHRNKNSWLKPKSRPVWIKKMKMKCCYFKNCY